MYVGIANPRWRENVPGIPGACKTHNSTYLVRGLFMEGDFWSPSMSASNSFGNMVFHFHILIYIKLTRLIEQCPHRNFRHTRFRTHRDELGLVMVSTVTVMTPLGNVYRMLLDGTSISTTWHIVGGQENMAFGSVQVSHGTHYLATADLESGFTAWLTMLPTGSTKEDTSSMNLGNAGRY